MYACGVVWTAWFAIVRVLLCVCVCVNYLNYGWRTRGVVPQGLLTVTTVWINLYTLYTLYKSPHIPSYPLTSPHYMRGKSNLKICSYNSQTVGFKEGYFICGGTSEAWASRYWRAHLANLSDTHHPLPSATMTIISGGIPPGKAVSSFCSAAAAPTPTPPLPFSPRTQQS